MTWHLQILFGFGLKACVFLGLGWRRYQSDVTMLSLDASPGSRHGLVLAALVRTAQGLLVSLFVAVCATA